MQNLKQWCDSVYQLKPIKKNKTKQDQTMKLLGKYLSSSEPVIQQLQTIYGINKTTACKVCGIVKLSQKTYLDDITASQKDKLEHICKVYVGIKGKWQMKSKMEKYIACRHYRGYRYVFGLPVRGQ